MDIQNHPVTAEILEKMTSFVEVSFFVIKTNRSAYNSHIKSKGVVCWMAKQIYMVEYTDAKGKKGSDLEKLEGDNRHEVERKIIADYKKKGKTVTFVIWS